MRWPLCLLCACALSACAPAAPAPEAATTTEAIGTNAATTIAIDAETCGSLDAIGYRCADGTVLSVRHDEESGCVVLWIGRRSRAYALPRVSEGVNSNGTVTFRQSGDVYVLTGAESGPYEDCRVMDIDPDNP